LFEAFALALLDIAATPPALVCCVAFWRLPAVFSSSGSGSKHSAIWSAAGNALVDLLLLPAAFVHVLFPWRIPSVFRAIVDDHNRVTMLTSATHGFIDLSFMLLALICCISLIQTHGMVGDVSTLQLAHGHQPLLLLTLPLSFGAQSTAPTHPLFAITF